MTPILCKGNFTVILWELVGYSAGNRARRRIEDWLHSRVPEVKSAQAIEIILRKLQVMVNKWILAVILGAAALAMYFGIIVRMS